MASRMKAATVRAYCLDSRARHRLRLIHASVRSTIQRLGSTTKRCGWLRLMISSVQVPVLATVAASFGPGSRHRRRCAREGEEAARAPVEDEPCAVAVLHRGGMNDDIQQEADRVDEDVPLAARDFLARIVALRVERRAPL